MEIPKGVDRVPVKVNIKLSLAKYNCQEDIDTGKEPYEVIQTQETVDLFPLEDLVGILTGVYRKDNTQTGEQINANDNSIPKHLALSD